MLLFRPPIASGRFQALDQLDLGLAPGVKGGKPKRAISIPYSPSPATTTSWPSRPGRRASR